MSAKEELAYAVKTAFDTYVTTRDELCGTLRGIGRDEFDDILSVAEELGAQHARTLIESRPQRFGIEPGALSALSNDDLERKLQRYVDANYSLDGAVAEQEQRRIEEGGPGDTRTIAFHGEFPLVDTKAMTITFPGGTPEPVMLREGAGPEPVEPEHSPTRTRSRGRGR